MSDLKSTGSVGLTSIQRAAARVFRIHGYGGSTMQQIADEVGLHKTSLYHHITSKETLLISIAESAMVEPLSQLERISAAEGVDPHEKLRQAVHMQVLALTERTDQIASFTMFVQEISDPEIRHTFVELRKRYTLIFEQLVAECLGVEASSAEAEMAAFAVLGMCNWILWWYQPDYPHTPESLASHFAQMAVSSVSGSPTGG